MKKKGKDRKRKKRSKEKKKRTVLSVTSDVTKAPRGPGASPFFFFFNYDVMVFF